MDDVERLTEKLHPLMPERVERWLQARRVGDPELAALIDRQVRDTAERTLKGVDPPILLNLPPPRAVAGPLNLGTVIYAGDRHTAGLRPQELLNHLCIVGRSGAGKTNAVFNVLLQLSDRRVPWVFLDVKRTARHLKPLLAGRLAVHTAGRPVRPLGLSPFAPPMNIEPAVYAGYVIDLLARAFTLGAGSISILHKAIAALLARGVARPSIAAVLHEVESLPEKGRAGGWAVSAKRALESLAMALPNTPLDQSGVIRGLTTGNTVIELDGLNDRVRNFIAPLICLWLYLDRLGRSSRENLDLVLVIEEAQNFLPRARPNSSGSVMDMVLRQCRELGMGVITVAQHPHLFSSAALGNSFATLALNLKDVPDVNRAAGVLGLDDADKHALSLLPVGYAIVKFQDRYRKPFLIRIPAVAVAKGSVRDVDLASNNSPSGAGSGEIAGVGGTGGGFGQSAVSDQLLDEDAVRFLEDVIAHEDDGVKVRYARLWFSGDKGNRLRNMLVRTGWLDAETVRVVAGAGVSRKVLLRLSADAKKCLGMPRDPPGSGGLAHEYWRRHYASMLERCGYAVQIEAPRNGGAIDVLGTRDGKTIALEIETGKSRVTDNVRRCLHANIERVIVIVTDVRALASIERDLAIAGLLVPGRVQIHLAGQPFDPAAP